MNKITHHKNDRFTPPNDSVWFVALGGAGEIGMNLSLYGTCGKWLMVDCGITFPDDKTPGIEIIMPDISFITERRDDLVGLVLTHGHEDHYGAIEYLWQHLKCPVYTTAFTAKMLRAKLAYSGMEKSVKIIEQPIGGSFVVEPFAVEMIRAAHSIPEAHMLLITTPCGKVLHTGDWKIDANPVAGSLTDETRLEKLAAENIMAMVADSTGALSPGFAGSELDARGGLEQVMSRFHKRIAVTCFSSNIARIRSVMAAAAKNGRRTGLVGRSLWRNAEIAESCGYLPEFSDLLQPEEAMRLPAHKSVLICTGSQGEERAALSRIAERSHRDVTLAAGDAVIFSSRDIPGNERSIGHTQNLLISQGLEIVTWHDAKVHVSGHPCRDEIAKLYHWVKPHLAVPVHGEARHQTAHVKLAESCGIEHAIIPTDGQIIALGPNGYGLVDSVHHGRIGMDGKILRSLGHEIMKHRRKIGHEGVVVVTIVTDKHAKPMKEPQVTLLGVEDDHYIEEVRGGIIETVQDTLNKMARGSAHDDAAVKKAVLKDLKHMLTTTTGKRPMVEIHLIRL